ncbi:MAG: ParA family protein [Clostridiales bacterium]|nr:ParA family protein [Clostridiales bacterium]
MSKIIAVANQKGGVGKTTTCINLSSFVAAMGKRTLMIDIDPQGNCTSGIGVEKKELRASIYNVLVGECSAKDATVKTCVEGLDLIPSNIDLAGAEIELIKVPNREKVLRSILQPLKNNYDYIFIDCPPSLALLTVNALTAADSILIPIQGEFFALEGLSQLMNTIRLAKKHLNPTLEVEGVLLTMYDGRSNLVASVTSEIIKFFGKSVYTHRIPRNIKLGEAPSYGKPIMHFEPRCSGSIAYKALAEEFLERNKDYNYTKITSMASLKRKAVKPQQ